MNHYVFSDLYVGLEETFQVEITETQVSMFRKITGDINPLHIDRTFAVNHQYPDCIVYGMLTASFLSTLGGVYLPGEKCLIQSIESNFVRPVFVGDLLTIKGKIKEINDTVKQICIRVDIVNQRYEKVLRGIMKVGMIDE